MKRLEESEYRVIRWLLDDYGWVFLAVLMVVGLYILLITKREPFAGGAL